MLAFKLCRQKDRIGLATFRHSNLPAVIPILLDEIICSSGQALSPAGVASGTRQAESSPPQDDDLSASRGNDRFVCLGLPLAFASCSKAKRSCCCSPSRPAALEAVVGIFPEQTWSMASGLSLTPQASESPSSSSLSQNTEALEASGSAVTSSPSELQSDGQNNNEHIPLPALSASDLSSSLIGTNTPDSPGPLLHLQADSRDDDIFDNDDSMSEQSSGTAVMVGHPCSDEEDTAERRWRLAERRGNDIRRASALPCPKAVGTKGYLKLIVVRHCLPYHT